MQPEERDAAYLWDMLRAAQAARRFAGEMPLERFLDEECEMVRMAVERELEILGEAGRRMSDEFRENHPEIPWKEIVGLRNVISHQYEKVDYGEILRIVKKRLPDLIDSLQSLTPPPPESEEAPPAS